MDNMSDHTADAAGYMTRLMKDGCDEMRRDRDPFSVEGVALLAGQVTALARQRAHDEGPFENCAVRAAETVPPSPSVSILEEASERLLMLSRACTGAEAARQDAESRLEEPVSKGEYYGAEDSSLFRPGSRRYRRGDRKLPAFVQGLEEKVDDQDKVIAGLKKYDDDLHELADTVRRLKRKNTVARSRAIGALLRHIERGPGDRG